MKDPAHLPHKALVYISEDCFQAIQANPDNPKIYEYLETRQKCLKEIDKRRSINVLRQQRNFYATDKFKYPLGQRNFLSPGIDRMNRVYMANLSLWAIGL